MKWISFDTEFKDSHNEKLTPVCAVIRTANKTYRFWYDELDKFKECFNKFVEEEYYVLSFMSAAEFRFLLSIGYTREELKKVRMVDLYPMWRTILFGLQDYNWGKYVLLENGKKETIFTRPPKTGELLDGEWYQDKDGNDFVADNIKTRRYNPSLAHACLKLLDVDIDTEHKTEMRDIILYGEVDDYKNEILDYCESDTEQLQPLLQKMYNIIRTYDKTYREKDALVYGKWMLDIAVIESTGIPLHLSPNLTAARMKSHF